MKQSNNIIRKSYLDFLTRFLLNENIWSYLPSVVSTEFTDKDESFGSTLYQVASSNTQYYINEKPYQLVLPLILSLYESLDLDIDKIFLLRARLGLILNKGKSIINTPHVDFDKTDPIGKNHFNILYYFNTTDADTILYNERNDNIINSLEYVKNYNNFSVQYKIPCVKNTAALFDGSFFHSSTTPTDTNWRLVLNLNVNL